MIDCKVKYIEAKKNVEFDFFVVATSRVHVSAMQCNITTEEKKYIDNKRTKNCCCYSGS